MATPPRIVVGVDGSPESVVALQLAAREAEAWGTRLDAVLAHHAHWSGAMSPPPDWWDRLHAQSCAALDQVVHAALGGAPPVEVHQTVVADDPGPALVHAAEGAEALVIGSHTSSQLARLAIGSVAAYCLHHAPCPVVLVRVPHDHPIHHQLAGAPLGEDLIGSPPLPRQREG